MQTTTITQFAPVINEPTRLRLKISLVRDDVKFLLSIIREVYQHLPGQETAELWFSNWEQQFFQTYNPDSPLEEEREKAAWAFCYLIHYGIEQMICNNFLSPSEQIAWLKPHREALWILGKILPNRPIEDFLKSYQKQEAQKIFFTERDKIKVLIKKMKKKFFHRANQMNKKWSKRFKKCKKELLKTQKANELRGVYKRLNVLTEKVHKVLQNSKEALPGFLKLTKNITKQEDLFSKNLCDIENRLNKI